MKTGDIVEVGQLGGEIGGVHLINDSLINLSKGDDLILFMESFQTEGMPASLVNQMQGAYRTSSIINSTDLRDSREFSIAQSYNANELSAQTPLESVDKRNDLVLTVGDLINIAR